MGLQEKKERTKLTIQRKAIDLTLERGLAGFTMQELADASDVSRSTLFNYFPGKVDAVLGVSKTNGAGAAELERMLDDLLVAATPLEDAAKQVQATLSLLELGDEYKAIYRLMLQAVEREPKLKEAFDANNRKTVVWVASRLEQRFGNAVSPSDRELVAALVGSLLQEAIARYLDASPDQTLAQVFAGVVADASRLAVD
ncbi:MAG: TetR/AcrR family transcriptional regulator [Olegusella sp.]|nr:TetR/AcrR family transcriptional regulator [Olegusella sp.]